MKYLPNNTRAFFQSSPQVHRHNLSSMHTAVFAAATKKYRGSCGMVSPNVEALEFYTLNHLAALVHSRFTLNEPLPPWALEVLNTYQSKTCDQGMRMLHYIISISTREMRHLLKPADSFWATCKEKFGDNFETFLRLTRSTPQEAQAVARYMDEPPNTPIGNYTAGLAWAFYNGPWSGGFGGKKWGAIAETSAAFVEGKISMEALVDTGYTLAHNNAPIFDKGMMYSSQNKTTMITLLDVQRAGQVPELVLDPTGTGISTSALAKTAVIRVKNVWPEKFRGWVDWEAVHKAGAVGNYDELIKNPTEKAIPKAIKKHKPLVIAEDLLSPKPEYGSVISEGVFEVAGKNTMLDGNWEVSPGELVLKFKRLKGLEVSV